jgi:thiosulfate/3-mercaptopyruvate sulfurtransferase
MSIRTLPRRAETDPGGTLCPAPDDFAAAMSRAGIGSRTHVVAYDFGDGSTAARLWWLLRYFGHERVSLLDGGIKRWVVEGHPIEAGVQTYAPAEFTPEPHQERVVDAAAVERLRADPRALVLDVRMTERYEGRREPVDPVAGHIPGAKNRPYPGNVRSARIRAFSLPKSFTRRSNNSAPRGPGASRATAAAGSMPARRSSHSS